MANRSRDMVAALLRSLPSRNTSGADRAQCPDEEALADFLGGTLHATAKRALEGHLADCSDCLEDLAAAYTSSAELQIDQAPQLLVEKALAPVLGGETVFDVIGRLTKGSLELIRASVPVTWPVFAVNVRGNESASTGKVLQFSKSLGRFNVTVELEALEQGLSRFDVHIQDQLGRSAEGVRLTLSSEGREQASFLTQSGGRIVFERVLPADYHLAIIDDGGLVGAIQLSLTREL